MSSSSDRSSTSTPSSESESIASNSTIISEHASQPATQQTHHQPTSRHGGGRSAHTGRNDASNSICSPALTTNSNGTTNNNGAFTVRLEHHGGNRWSSSVTSSSNLSSRKSHHSNHNHQYNDGQSRQDQTSDTSSANTRDQNFNNSNQRITRSSQRAAQQFKHDHVHSDSNNGDDQQHVDTEKDSGRRVKRRKGESSQDTEQDNNQTSAAPQQPAMANICPADYQLPSYNSFQLYREIRNSSSRQLSKLDHVQPKRPHGFKEYLLNSGLYALDGNKLGINLTVNSQCGSSDQTNMDCNSKFIDQGADKKSTVQIPANFKKILVKSASQVPTQSITNPRLLENSSSPKLSNTINNNQIRKLVPPTIPKISPPPSKLEKNSALYVLFRDHEVARHQMRIQHLKERERLILSAEQEVLRTYNRAAIADRRQKHPLSACTYLYYQERYHYSDNSGDKKQLDKQKQQNHDHQVDQQQQRQKVSSNRTSQDTIDNSPPIDIKDSNGGGHDADKDKPASNCDSDQVSVANNPVESDITAAQAITNQTKNNNKHEEQFIEVETKMDESSSDNNLTISENDTNDNSRKLLIDELTLSDVDSGVTKTDSIVKTETSDQNQAMDLDEDDNNRVNDTDTIINEDDQAPSSDFNDNNNKNKIDDLTIIEDRISDEELKILNKDKFLEQLQEIDEKWEKIRNDMLVRHRNEADSLYAVQSLEWEWKAKELGLCDVRKPFKLDPEFVPRIEIITHDY